MDDVRATQPRSGDVVNTAARLQSSAGSGEILLSHRVERLTSGGFAGAERRTLSLKGKAEPEPVVALRAKPQVRS